MQSTFKQTIIQLISSWNQTKKTQTTNKRTSARTEAMKA
jgi:hypothetical protein